MALYIYSDGICKLHWTLTLEHWSLYIYLWGTVSRIKNDNDDDDVYDDYDDDDDYDDEDGEDDDDDDDEDDDGNDDVHQQSSWLMSFTIPQEEPHSKLLHCGTTASYIPL